MCRDFESLGDLPQGSTVTSSVFARDTDLLGSLGHLSKLTFIGMLQKMK